MGERRIAGRYELVEQLGTSSWRAVDTDLEREVLVRMPGHDVSAARLTHHGIVPLFDQGQEDGVPYAVYEYLAGGSLDRRLAAGPLSETEVDRVAADVTGALAYAHGQGVTHGSIGPASVMLGADGDAKLAGFAGTGTTEEDQRALAALLETLGASTAVAAVAADDAGVTAVLPPPRPAGRRPLVLALAALAPRCCGDRRRAPRDVRRVEAGRRDDRIRVGRDLDRIDRGSRRPAAVDGGGDDDRDDDDRSAVRDDRTRDDGVGAADSAIGDDGAPDDRAGADNGAPATGDDRPPPPTTEPPPPTEATTQATTTG